MERTIELGRQCTNRCTPEAVRPCQHRGVFWTLFERTCDAVLILQAGEYCIADANPAALRMMRASAREELCGHPITAFAGELQSCGANSIAVLRRMAQEAAEAGTRRFEWEARRCDGSELLLEMVLTALDGELSRVSDSCRLTHEPGTAPSHPSRPLGGTPSPPQGGGEGSSGGEVHGELQPAMVHANWGREPATAPPHPVPTSLGRVRNQPSPPQGGGEGNAEGGLLGRLPNLRVACLLGDPPVHGEQAGQMVAFCRDITEKRRTLQALKDSEALHRALFDATSQGVTLHDDRAFFSANPAAVRILRLQSAEDIIGRHPSEVSAPVQPDGQPSETLARQHIADCLRDGVKRFEWLTRASDGGEFLMDVQLTAVDVGGRKIIQAVLDDISQRKAAEAELRRSLESEKILGQLRANFVSMVSHEFRTPLSIIQSSAEILENYLDRMRPEERGEHLRSIKKNTGRMASLMEEVLFIGRLEAGKMEFRPGPIRLDVILERLTEEVEKVTGRRCPISLKLDPACVAARADERLLQPLLTNLLTNAVKYSAPASPVELAVERLGGEAKITVRDRGIGIPDGDREWLFQPFHRGQNVCNRPGSGLGLTIVRRCVELHSGRLEFQSAVGQGTTFTLWLPLFEKALP